MEIKRVRDRGDGIKQVTIPKKSDIEEGDYVKILKVEGKPRNIDKLGFDITCNHLETSEEKFGDIPLEHSADMAVCKECYIKLNPQSVIESEDIDVPEGIQPGEMINE